MNLNRREFIRLMGLAGAAGIFPRAGFSAGSDGSKLYDMPAFGNARILHFTTCQPLVTHGFCTLPIAMRR